MRDKEEEDVEVNPGGACEPEDRPSVVCSHDPRLSQSGLYDDDSMSAYSVLSSVSGIIPSLSSGMGTGVGTARSGPPGHEHSVYNPLLLARSSHSTVNPAPQDGLSHTLYLLVRWLFPSSWDTYILKTWTYNAKPIFFVMFFCFSSLCVAPLLYQLYGVTYDKSIDGGEEFATCLM